MSALIFFYLPPPLSEALHLLTTPGVRLGRQWDVLRCHSTWMTNVWDLVASHKQLNIPHLILPFKACRRTDLASFLQQTCGNGICSQTHTHRQSPHLRQVFFPAVSSHSPPQFSEQLDVELHKRFRNWKTHRMIRNVTLLMLNFQKSLRVQCQQTFILLCYVLWLKIQPQDCFFYSWPSFTSLFRRLNGEHLPFEDQSYHKTQEQDLHLCLVNICIVTCVTVLDCTVLIVRLGDFLWKRLTSWQECSVKTKQCD